MTTLNYFTTDTTMDNAPRINRDDKFVVKLDNDEEVLLDAVTFYKYQKNEKKKEQDSDEETIVKKTIVNGIFNVIKDGEVLGYVHLSRAIMYWLLQDGFDYSIIKKILKEKFGLGV